MLLTRKQFGGWVSVTGKKSTNVVSNLPYLVGEWKTRFFFSRLKSLGEIVPRWGVPTEWKEKLVDILGTSSSHKGRIISSGGRNWWTFWGHLLRIKEVASASLTMRVVLVEPLGVEQSTKIYAKIEEKVAKEQIRARGRHRMSCKQPDS
ncbi:hypothetical protein ACLOJK_009483 [Asimina triloba]